MNRNYNTSNICKVCDAVFIATGYNPKTIRICSKKCKNKLRTEYHRKYVDKNIEHVSRYSAEFRKKMKSTWGWGKGSETNIGNNTEREVGSRLSDYGFTDILYCNKTNRFFSGDYIATKDGKNCIIEVTSAYTHPLYRHKIFCRRLDLDLYIIFIKPDLSTIILKKIDIYDSKRGSCLLYKEIMGVIAAP
jgi:hypothetical protein